MDERSQRIDDRLSPIVIAAAVLTIPATVIQESHAAAPWPRVAYYLNWGIWLAFVMEVVVMLAVVRSRRDFLRHHFPEVVIVVLTPPFGLPGLQTVRVLRLLRLARLLRLTPLFRLISSREGPYYLALLALLVAIAGGASFAAVEGVSFGNGVYWAIETMTTVGYGDIVPHTAAGKIVACTVMLLGIGLATVVIGAFAQRFVSSRQSDGDGDRVTAGSDEDVMRRLDAIGSELQDLQALLARGRGRRPSQNS